MTASDQTQQLKIKIPYCPHLGQQEFHEDPHRFRVMACGRRFGKTLAACAEAVREATLRPKAVIWWIAPAYSLAMIGWRKLEELLPLPIIAQKMISERRFVLVNGSSLWIKSADNPDTLRGEGLDLAIVDEAAFVKEEAWTASLRPALADKLGRGVFISTPLGRNWFYQSFLRGQGDDPEWKSWRFRTADNPIILPGEIEAARRGMPERIFRQEFEAEFIEDAGAVFRKVAEAATAVEQERAIGGHCYIMGIDLGRINDFTVISVLDVTQEPAALVALDRFNQIDWQFQIGRIKAMVERFRPEQVVVDQTGVGDPIVEQLRRELSP
jgi:phage FluMu gp28-like protein